MQSCSRSTPTREGMTGVPWDTRWLEHDRWTSTLRGTAHEGPFARPVAVSATGASLRRCTVSRTRTHGTACYHDRHTEESWWLPPASSSLPRCRLGTDALLASLRSPDEAFSS
ncbi:hypothetical protein H257_00789 [Aphanomyces astaci]|uniref:Uncharacterized protein n=1 Tax=Aphanomyces astaci TaxID=112090 RepID=W4HC54_APHAT|nr:hypothetical protein H257_00789 [Aphanomyces astaci]ETV89555.1 hypothetical protein H257_00789 [Aphanomyces astaci]|eukprot:XP_009821955.1 hypothetical protein H257_00789 [Aphanomyces astaci]